MNNTRSVVQHPAPSTTHQSRGQQYANIPKSHDIGALFASMAELIASTTMDLSNNPKDPLIGEMRQAARECINQQKQNDADAIGPDAIRYAQTADGMPTPVVAAHTAHHHRNKRHKSQHDTDPATDDTHDHPRNIYGSTVDPMDYARNHVYNSAKADRLSGGPGIHQPLDHHHHHRQLADESMLASQHAPETQVLRRKKSVNKFTSIPMYIHYKSFAFESQNGTQQRLLR